MKPEKVDHYLNKRREREGRLSAGGNLESDLPPDPHNNGPDISSPRKQQKPPISPGAHQSTLTDAKKETINLNEKLLQREGPNQDIQSNEQHSPKISTREITNKSNACNKERITDLGYERESNSQRMHETLSISRHWKKARTCNKKTKFR